MVAVNTEYTETVDGEEFVEVAGEGGGDYAPTLSFRGDDPVTILGTFTGTEKNVGQNKSSVHSFTQAKVEGDPNHSGDHDEIQAWGSAILDDRLASVDPGSRVKVVYTGNRLPTRNGSAKEFKVLVARSALAR